MNAFIDIKKDFQVSVIIRSSKERAFNALTIDLDKWWGHTDNPDVKKGDIFTVSWGKPWYQFEIITYEPFSDLTWKCIDANQIIERLDGVEKEWVGTTLYWTIKTHNNKEIELSFRHEGLHPDFICYDFCSSAWDEFITQGLKDFLEG